MFGSVFKPHQEIEGFTNIAAMIKLPCDRRQIPCPFSDVMGFFLKDIATFLLGKIHQAAVFRIGMSAAMVASARPSGACFNVSSCCSCRSTYRMLLMTPDNAHWYSSGEGSSPRHSAILST